MRLDHPALVEQGQPTRGFEDALYHEHDIGAAGIIFVKHQRNIMLIRPGQNSVAKLRDLLAVADHDGIFADKVDTADMAVKIDTHARPVEPRCHLLDMGRLSGAVISSHDDAA